MRARLIDCIFGQAVFSYVPFSVRTRTRTQHRTLVVAVVGTERVAFERAVGRTVVAGADAAAAAAVAGVSDGTPGPVIEREPNRGGFGHR